MLCPYCSSPLQTATVLTKTGEEAAIHECFTCGGHWFPRWLANDIAAAQAINVDSIAPGREITPPELPRCPQCQTRLTLLSGESVPRGLHIYACPQGHGNFFPHGSLLQFKKAQEAKITYHQVWGVPIKSIFAVLLPVAVVLGLLAGIPLTLRQLEQSQEQRIAAEDPIATPAITEIPPDSVIISFTTRVNGTATVTLYQNEVLIDTIVATTTPTNVHSATINDLIPDVPYTYVISLKTATDTIISRHYPLTLATPSL